MDHQIGLSSPAFPGHRAVAGSRRYRSKAQRPCDVCRSRKVLCNIPDPSQPCQLCERLGRRCTFVGNPSKRQPSNNGPARRSPSATGGLSDAMDTNPAAAVMECSPINHDTHDSVRSGVRDNRPESGGINAVDQTHQDMVMLASPGIAWPNDTEFDWSLDMDPFARSPTGGQTSPSHLALDFLSNPLNYAAEALPDATGDSYHMQEASSIEVAAIKDTTAGAALDLKPGHSTTFIGFSNESDPFALNHFPFNKQGKIDFFRVTYRKPTSEVSPGHSTDNRPIHFLQSQTGTAVEARRVIDACLPDLDSRAELEAIVDNTAGVALVKLFLKFVFPALPIVSRTLVLKNIEEYVKEAPTGVLAGIYALSLPFAPWDETLCLSNAYAEPSSDALWKVSYTCLQREMHFPGLSCIQIYLLLLNQPQFDSVSVETPFVWSTAASMLGMAQSLGLHAEPSGWNVPAWEVRLRRRLWWAVFVETTWRSVTHGRASMINHDDWDVTPLTSNDFTTESDTYVSADADDFSPDYFIQLCSLTQIADGICRQFYTLRAVSKQQKLDLLISQARGLRQELLDWLENLPECLQLHTTRDAVSPDDPIESHAPLYIAYYTAHILLFRALLRPIIRNSSESNELQGSTSAILQASRSLVQTVMKFICSLDARHQSAFWPAYTRHLFSYPGLFCFMLSTQKVEPHMETHDRGLLDTWRKMLRTRVHSWPLLRFASVKIDAIYWSGAHKPVS